MNPTVIYHTQGNLSGNRTPAQQVAVGEAVAKDLPSSVVSEVEEGDHSALKEVAEAVTCAGRTMSAEGSSVASDDCRGLFAVCHLELAA